MMVINYSLPLISDRALKYWICRQGDDLAFHTWQNLHRLTKSKMQ